MPNGTYPSLKEIFASKVWVVRKTIWPFPEGYGIYNWKTKTILDTGLSKEEAELRCAELNKGQSL